jgi:hypothetical protein
VINFDLFHGPTNESGVVKQERIPVDQTELDLINRRLVPFSCSTTALSRKFEKNRFFGRLFGHESQKKRTNQNNKRKVDY